MTYPPPIEDPNRRRIAVDEIQPVERTPGQMLGALRTMVNRQVWMLEGIAAAHQGTLPIEWDEMLDTVLERVCKLSREDRAREPTDDELLKEHDAKGGA